MISVIVATFGSEEWRDRGDKVSQSLAKQSRAPASVHRIHGESLAQARNQGAEESEGDWLLFLDADDHIDDYFIHHMAMEVSRLNSDNYLIRPSCRLVTETCKPYVLRERDIRQANFMIIGTLVRRDIFLQVGGFRDLPLLEDWDLWIRCVGAGAKYASCPNAVYYIGSNDSPRNKPGRNLEMKTYKEIKRAYGFR